MKLYYKSGRIEDVEMTPTINISEILQVKITTNNEEKLKEISDYFDIDLRPFQNREDIEISSHYIDTANQLTLNLNTPVGLTDKIIEEETIHYIIKHDIVFVFISQKVNEIIDQVTELRYDKEDLKFSSHLEFLVFQLGAVSDYYADVVEMISNKIRATYYDIINTSKVSDDNLDRLTHYNFSNFLVRESLSEFQRIILLLRRKYGHNIDISEKLELEINDLNVISEHIQYNFERVGDLKSNVHSKIELEQNKIFKTLTVITVCVSIPTLIAGIYGMNFKNMSELEFQYGYPIITIIIILSLIVPLIYFKRKKWF